MLSSKPVRRSASARTLVNTELFVLTKQSFDRIVFLYPELRQQFAILSKQRLLQKCRPDFAAALSMQQGNSAVAKRRPRDIETSQLGHNDEVVSMEPYSPLAGLVNSPFDGTRMSTRTRKRPVSVAQQLQVMQAMQTSVMSGSPANSQNQVQPINNHLQDEEDSLMSDPYNRWLLMSGIDIDSLLPLSEVEICRSHRKLGMTKRQLRRFIRLRRYLRENQLDAEAASAVWAPQRSVLSRMYLEGSGNPWYLVSSSESGDDGDSDDPDDGTGGVGDDSSIGSDAPNGGSIGRITPDVNEIASVSHRPSILANAGGVMLSLLQKPGAMQNLPIATQSALAAAVAAAASSSTSVSSSSSSASAPPSNSSSSASSSLVIATPSSPATAARRQLVVSDAPTVPNLDLASPQAIASQASQTHVINSSRTNRFAHAKAADSAPPATQRSPNPSLPIQVQELHRKLQDQRYQLNQLITTLQLRLNPSSAS